MSQNFFSRILRPRQYALLIGYGTNEEHTWVYKKKLNVELGQSAKELEA